jgi:hypothetical protein
MDERPINSLLLCCVCEKPFVDPVTAQDSRRGCRSCLEKTGGTLTPILEWIVLEMLSGLPVRCTQCDELNIKRGNLKQHEQTECRLAVVPCEAADIKCTWQGAREKRDKHSLECVFEPLRPALQEIITENKQLRERIEKLELSVNQLRGNQQ